MPADFTLVDLSALPQVSAANPGSLVPISKSLGGGLFAVSNMLFPDFQKELLETAANGYFTGNVAIGTLTPIAPFHVEGHGYIHPTTINTANTDGLLVQHDTVVTQNGTFDDFGISSQITQQSILAGLYDQGQRVGITGDAYAGTVAFAGHLKYQFGVRGRAGIRVATPGAKVDYAYGAYFEVLNEQAGVEITNAYALYLNNNSVGGTIVNRWDLFASSPLAWNYFAGKVGIGVVNPAYPMEVATAAANDTGILVTNTGAGSAGTGFRATISGASAISYGFYANVTGATDNYSFYGAAGILKNVGNADIGGTVKFSHFGAGTATFDASGNISSVSDERHKRDIRPFERGIEALMHLRPILHGYNELSGLDQERNDYAGFSAQNVEGWIPEAVSAGSDGTLSFSDRPVLAVVVNSVQDHEKRISRLEAA